MQDLDFKQHGNFSWNELMTTDVAAAKAFYGELFSWEMREQPIADGSYTLLYLDGHKIGGIMPLPPGAKGTPPVWGSYVSVADLTQALQRVEALGGRIIMASQEVPNVGRFAVISDPQGAMLALIEYDHAYLG